jgi:hypothetical protein
MMTLISASGDRQAFIRFLPLAADRASRSYSNGLRPIWLTAVEGDP